MSCWKTDHYFCKIAVAVSLFFLSACEGQRRPAGFYPVDSLITAQADYLATTKAGLFKEALLGGEADTLTYTPGDSMAWSNELDIFRKLDIVNKPVNSDSYIISDGLFDPGSNLKIKAITADKAFEEELAVVYLKIYYQGSILKPRKIEALYDEKNLLYKSARLLSMHFHQVENKTVLTSYSIKGGQKVILGDSVAFYISGKILMD